MVVVGREESWPTALVLRELLRIPSSHGCSSVFSKMRSCLQHIIWGSIDSGGWDVGFCCQNFKRAGGGMGCHANAQHAVHACTLILLAFFPSFLKLTQTRTHTGVHTHAAHTTYNATAHIPYTHTNTRACKQHTHTHTLQECLGSQQTS
jgi:hypothetical protein